MADLYANMTKEEVVELLRIAEERAKIAEQCTLQFEVVVKVAAALLSKKSVDCQYDGQRGSAKCDEDHEITERSSSRLDGS
eukprot:gene32335-5407_t